MIGDTSKYIDIQPNSNENVLQLQRLLYVKKKMKKNSAYERIKVASEEYLCCGNYYK